LCSDHGGRIGVGPAAVDRHRQEVPELAAVDQMMRDIMQSYDICDGSAITMKP